MPRLAPVIKTAFCAMFIVISFLSLGLNPCSPFLVSRFLRMVGPGLMSCPHLDSFCRSVGIQFASPANHAQLGTPMCLVAISRFRWFPLEGRRQRSPACCSALPSGNHQEEYAVAYKVTN